MWLKRSSMNRIPKVQSGQLSSIIQGLVIFFSLLLVLKHIQDVRCPHTEFQKGNDIF